MKPLELMAREMSTDMARTWDRSISGVRNKSTLQYLASTKKYLARHDSLLLFRVLFYYSLPYAVSTYVVLYFVLLCHSLNPFPSSRESTVSEDHLRIPPLPRVSPCSEGINLSLPRYTPYTLVSRIGSWLVLPHRIDCCPTNSVEQTPFATYVLMSSTTKI